MTRFGLAAAMAAASAAATATPLGPLAMSSAVESARVGAAPAADGQRTAEAALRDALPSLPFEAPAVDDDDAAVAASGAPLDDDAPPALPPA